MISSKRFACSTDIIRLWSFIFIVSITSSVVVYGAAVQCDDDELDEAQKSFRNCVESAKAGIVSRHAPQLESEYEQDDNRQGRQIENDLCGELDTMLSGCETEVEALSRCKGRGHVENLKILHLTSIADVLKALNEDLKVEECQVFHKKESPSTHGNDDPELFEETEVHRFPENGPESISCATSRSLETCWTLISIFTLKFIFV